jgi:L-iditol 2-dehydrogenase
MRVAMYYSNEDVRIEEMPVPDIGPGEILLKVMASGICGSDVMYWYRKGKTPLVLGHEVAGEVAAVGEGVTKYRVGQRVVVAHHVPCNTCHYCLRDHHTMCETLRATNFDPGGFGEYLRVPAINVDRGVFEIPDELSFEEAHFVEPLACVYRGQRKAGVNLGASVLVIGSGISGLLHIRLARALGAALVVSTDVVSFRRTFALSVGADAVLDAASDVPYEFMKLNRGRGADIVILTAGAPAAIRQAMASVDRGGTVLFFAPAPEGSVVEMAVNDLMWKREITLTSTYAANHAEHRAAMEFIRSGRVRVGDMITHVLPLAETPRGFALVAQGRDSVKVVIQPQK